MKGSIRKLFPFFMLVLMVLSMGCSPQEKSTEYSMNKYGHSMNGNIQSNPQVERRRRSLKVHTRGPDATDILERRNPEMKVDQQNILTITKESTFPIMNARKINEVCISLLAVPSQNFESVICELRLDESLKLYSGTVAMDKGMDSPEYEILEPILESEKYKNQGLVLLDSSMHDGLPVDDFTSFVKIDFHNKKVIHGSVYNHFAPSEQDLWMMKEKYMTSQQQWSKSWIRESTRYTPLTLKSILKSAQVGDTFKIFFIVSASKVKDGLYTSDFIYMSGLDDPSNPNLVQEFTIIN